jgi:hypothetical protein
LECGGKLNVKFAGHVHEQHDVLFRMDIELVLSETREVEARTVHPRQDAGDFERVSFGDVADVQGDG